MNVRDHRDPHRGLRLALGGSVLAGAGFAAWLLWGTTIPALELAPVEADDLFAPDVIERGNDYRRGTRAFWAGSIAVQIVVLALVAWRAHWLVVRLARTWFGRRLLGSRHGSDTAEPWLPPVRTGAFLGVVAALLVWLASLPLGAARLSWRRRFDLSEQSYAGWLLDAAVGLLVTSVLVVLAVVIVVWLAGRLGGAWWWAAGGLLALCGFLLILLQPLVIEPLRNDFSPINDPALVTDIGEIAATVGVEIGGIEIRDQSRRTQAANARVTGLGPSRRVVVDDTLLAADVFGRAEVRSVLAHELAHVARSHRWKGVAWFALLVLPSTALLAQILRRIRPGGAANPTLVPAGLLVALLIFLATSPLQNAVSRRYEAEADWIALRATDDPGALERLVSGFVITNAGDPTRPGWVTQLLGTHPSTLERIAMARAYAERAG